MALRRATAIPILLAAVLALVSLVGGALLRQAWIAPGPLREERVVLLPRGAGLIAIARHLAEAGAIDNPWIFLAALTLDGAGRTLKAGEYAIPGGLSMARIAELLRAGKVVQHKVTVPEGWTVAEVLEDLRDRDFLVGAVGAVEEGALRPDTYFAERGVEREALLARMRAAQTALIDEIWARHPGNAVIKDRHALLVLASIIERETGRDDERPRVAAVFENRLARGMKLQSDPTVIYGLSDRRGSLDRELTREDLKTPHAWNTYVIDGLPPTPIANPGAKSLEAVMAPAPSDDLYFVADGTGGHVFASTLEAHNRNVAAWRRIGAQTNR